jgi:hypothetical protein
MTAYLARKTAEVGSSQPLCLSVHMSDASRELLLLPWRAGMVLVLSLRWQTIGGLSITGEDQSTLMYVVLT